MSRCCSGYPDRPQHPAVTYDAVGCPVCGAERERAGAVRRAAALEAERDALAAHVGRLGKALAPIVRYAESADDPAADLPDSIAVAHRSSGIPGRERSITLGDLRRAVAALAATPDDAPIERGEP